jgi:hypothetical protein
MLRHVLFVAALLCAGSAHALDTYRFGSRLVEVGDSVGKLVELAGQPAYKEPIETPQGGREGERWQYAQGNVTVTFVIKESRIAAIEQTHN